MLFCILEDCKPTKKILKLLVLAESGLAFKFVLACSNLNFQMERKEKEMMADFISVLCFSSMQFIIVSFIFDLRILVSRNCNS